jgi:hypothetical protein
LEQQLRGVNSTLRQYVGRTRPCDTGTEGDETWGHDSHVVDPERTCESEIAEIWPLLRKNFDDLPVSLKWPVGAYALPKGPRTCLGNLGGQFRLRKNFYDLMWRSRLTNVGNTRVPRETRVAKLPTARVEPATFRLCGVRRGPATCMLC